MLGGVAGALSSSKAKAADSAGAATAADGSVKKRGAGAAAASGATTASCWVGPHIYVWLDVFALNQHVQHGVMADLAVVGEVLRTCERGMGREGGEGEATGAWGTGRELGRGGERSVFSSAHSSQLPPTPPPLSLKPS